MVFSAAHNVTTQLLAVCVVPSVMFHNTVDAVSCEVSRGMPAGG